MDVVDGDDGVCCRICRLPASLDNPLFSPCKCSGSIKYVHQDCLLSWLNHSGHKHCELCRHRFRFRPVYAPDAPSRLPWTELIWGLAQKSAKGLQLGARVLAVVATWLFVVPLLTCWMWRLAFLTSFSQGLHELSLRFQPVLVLADCIQGSLISSALIFMVLLATYTADQIRAYWQVIQPPNPPQAEVQEADETEESEFEEQEEDDETESEVSLDQRVQDWMAQERAGPSSSASQSQHREGNSLEEQMRHQEESREELQQDSPAQQFANRRRVRVVRPARAVAGGGLDRQPQPPQNEQGNEPQPQNEALLQNQEQDRLAEREQFAFNELIGLEGPFQVLLENAGTVIFTIWVFMIAALWMPFMLGRVVVPFVLTWKEALSTSGLWHAAQSTFGFFLLKNTQGALQSPPSLSGNATAAPAQNLTSDATASDAWEGLASKIALLPLIQRLAGELEAHLSGPGLSDWVCLGMGYSVLLILATLAFWSLVVWKLLWGAHIRQGLRGQTDILRAAFADFGHQTRVHLGYAAVMVKVSVVLTLELTLLPALHGCWVDLCLLPLFGSSWADRMLWLQASPISFLLVHWVLGMGFLMIIATFLSVLRQQLRQGALPFFRDPYEGDEEPMRALMMLGLGQQLEREAYAMSCLACLTVLILHFPLRLTKLALPSMLPLRLSLSSPFAEAPTDLLLFHFLLPLTIPRLRVRRAYALVTRAYDASLLQVHDRQIMEHVVRRWLRLASRALSLHDFLLPGQPGAPREQPPIIIPHGMPASKYPQSLNTIPTGQDEDSQAQRWRAEVDGARQRSGRLMLLLALMIGSIMLLNTILFNLPVLLGRLIFSTLGLPSQHDMYNALCGAYALWGLILGLWHLTQAAGTGSLEALGNVIVRWGQTGLRLGALTVLGLGVLPLLIGLFLELTVLPVRLRPGETPSYFIYQDWAVGLLFLRLFTRVALGWPRREGRARDGAGEDFDSWLREPLQRLRGHTGRLRREGLARIKFGDAFSNVLWPLISFWGVAVCLPFVLTRGVAPRLPLADEKLLHALFTYAWAAELGAFVGFVCAVKALSALERLGAKLRDQRYLLHRELINISD